MTDAAVSVTQSAVERFTEQYLRSLGCSIEIREDRWVVTVPDGADTALSSGDLTLVLADNYDEKDNVMSLHPESGLFQQILSEAGERCPTGKLSIETEDTEVEIPIWLQKSDVEVEEAKFTPYYDRKAVVFLFKVSIETVSEFQRELLRAIAIDARSGEYLPKLEDVFLRLTSLEGNSTTSNPTTELNKSDVDSLLDTARDQLIDRIQALVDEIHKEASRAADVEVEEYRQMQQQRIEELEEEHSNLSSKINELSETLNGGGEEKRVHALKERKELKSEFEEIDEELSDLRERREQGFPERQQEIRERHALDVRTTPLTVTQVEYERGEIDIELVNDSVSKNVTVGYGSGVGVTEEVRCAFCDRRLSNENPLQTIKGGLQCRKCGRSDNG
jgi:hypothetical protein